MEDSVLNKTVSMCERANRPDRITTVNLLALLQTDKYKSLADTCGQIEDKAARRKFKGDNVPVITVSGLFRESRKEENLVRHSGLVCLDLDSVQEINSLQKKVIKLLFVAYCGKSISGTGLFVIIPIPESSPHEHKQRYATLEKYFFKHFGITGTVDPQPKNVAAARYVSYDPQAYFNHKAGVFDELPAIPAPPGRRSFKRQLTVSNDYDKVLEMADIIQARRLDFCPDYYDYLRVAFSLASGLGENGRNVFHAVCQYSTAYNYPDAEAKYSEAVKSANGTVTLATFFGMCKDFGLTAIKIPPLPRYVPEPIQAMTYNRKINKYIHLVELADTFIYLFDTFPELEGRKFTVNGQVIDNPFKWIIQTLCALRDHFPANCLTGDLEPEYQQLYNDLLTLKDQLFRITTPIAEQRFSNSKTKAA